LQVIDSKGANLQQQLQVLQPVQKAKSGSRAGARWTLLSTTSIIPSSKQKSRKIYRNLGRGPGFARLVWRSRSSEKHVVYRSWTQGSSWF